MSPQNSNYSYQKKKKSKHWVGQKVRLGLSVTSYGKFRTNLLANPAPLSTSPIKAVKCFWSNITYASSP